MRLMWVLQTRFFSSKKRTILGPSNCLSASKVAQLVASRMQEKNALRLIDCNHEANAKFESIAAQRFFEYVKYHDIADHHDRELPPVSPPSTTSSACPVFPLNLTTSIGDYKSPDIAPKKPFRTIDRGFYVNSKGYRDDYVEGTVCEIPDIEMVEKKGKLPKKSPPTRHWTRYGSEDAVEKIQFQLPHQKVNQDGDHLLKDEEEDDNWMDRYGTVDPSIAPSEIRCSGCAAHFHCQDASLPGFLPVELFTSSESPSNTLCRRCFLLKVFHVHFHLKKHDFLLNVNVSNVDYVSVMGHLKLRQEALLVLLIDMTDFPGSIFRALPDIVGDNKPMIVVGNKVDLLPADAQDHYLRHFRDCLISTIKDLGFDRRFNILHTALISAKTRFGIEELITQIFLKWTDSESMVRNDIYLVGCTNTGKSTLFNVFLQSDLCKVRAIDLVERATTSVWPGTTLGLLKMPVMNPSSYKLEIRRRRLLSGMAWLKREHRLVTRLLNHTDDDDQREQFTVLQGSVENSFIDEERLAQPTSMKDRTKQLRIDGQMFVSEDGKKRNKVSAWNPDDPIFARGSWCLDTPGTVADDQITNKLTLSELIVVVPKHLLRPRTFLVRAEQTLLVGGLALIRVVHVLSPPSSVHSKSRLYLTIFASLQLPIHQMASSKVEGFLDCYIGSPVLGAPLGDHQRLKELPPLLGRDVHLVGDGNFQSVADITLSSLGWMSLTASVGTAVHLSVSTPGGVGIYIRRPSLLPFAVNLRGSRIPNSGAFQLGELTRPEPSRGRRRSSSLN